MKKYIIRNNKILLVGESRKLTNKMSIKDAPPEYLEKQYSHKQLKKLGVV